jgi:hypothetical protein
MAKTMETSRVADFAREALALRRERDPYDRPGGMKERAETFVAGSLLQAGLVDDADLLAMDKCLKDSPADYEEIAGSLRRMETAIASPNISCARWKRPSLLNQYCSPGALTHLASLRWNPAKLWALAAYHVAAKKPEVFGDVEDFDAAQARLKALDARLSELYKLLETAVTPDDVVFLETNAMMRREGWISVAFRITGGAVRLGQDAGKHLIDWLLAHPEVKL